MEANVIQYDKQDSIAFITLNRPERRNAYNIQMRDELFEALGAVRDDPEVRVTIIRAAGDKAFCAGADLSEFLTAPAPVFARKARFERDIWGRFLGIYKPFIVAMHGFVLGSGIEIACCCDIRLATTDAKFGMPEVALGIIPAAGGSQTLPRIIGKAKTMEMLLEGKWLDANEALLSGLVSRLLPGKKELWEAAEKLAERISALNPLVVSCAKQAVVRGLDITLAEGLELEASLSALVKESKNGA